MEKDTIIEFILNGYFLNAPFRTITTRNFLVNMLGVYEGINKKNGTYEMLRNKNIIYYLGNSTRGYLQGVRIYNLLPIKFEYSVLLKLLEGNKIEFIRDKEYIKLENGVKIYFEKSQKYIEEIIKADNHTIERKLLNV
jgi:hypothetical protein